MGSVSKVAILDSVVKPCEPCSLLFCVDKHSLPTLHKAYKVGAKILKRAITKKFSEINSQATIMFSEKYVYLKIR